MTKKEIEDKIAYYEKALKNASLPESAKAKFKEMKEKLEKELESAEEKPKVEPKKSEKTESAPKREKGEKDVNCDELIEREEKAKKSGYDINEILTKARSQKAKSKARAEKRKSEPKKTQSTKNKEAVEKTTKRVTTNVEKRAEKGAVTEAEVEKLISEYKDAIKKLEALLEMIKNAEKKGRGGSLKGRKKAKQPKVIRTYFDDIAFEYGRGGRTTGTRTDLDRIYHAKPEGKRRSSKYAVVDMNDGGAYSRQNGNQYYNQKGYYIDENGKKHRTIGRATGKRTYYEHADNRSDKKKWL